jgi:transposase InsO family protein
VFGYSKQSYHKRPCRDSEPNLSYLKHLVMEIRSTLPRTGGRKLYHLIARQLHQSGIKMGRDKFFDYLRNEHLLVVKRKKYHITTNSKHWMRTYPNIIKDIKIVRPEQVWVADITYLQVKKMHYYLHLITDAYSKKIVGYALANNMLASTTTAALNMALKNRSYKDQLIHHSDRGLQYSSSLYTSKLKNHNILISMTEQSDPYENAVAERVNGILKDEFGLDSSFDSYSILKKNVEQSIALYNQVRIHMSIDMVTPNEAHLQNQIKLKTWKVKSPNRKIEMDSYICK